MPKRISKKATDPNEIAFQVVQAATTETAIGAIRKGVIEGMAESAGPALYSQVMAEIGRKGGKIGGKRRSKS
jgi:hypothetical protein